MEQHARRERHEQVGMSDANLVRTLDLSYRAFAIVVERSRFDLAAHKEMRDGRPALRGAFGHDAAERARHFNASGFFRCSRRGRRGGCNLHIRSQNLSTRT